MKWNELSQTEKSCIEFLLSFAEFHCEIKFLLHSRSCRKRTFGLAGHHPSEAVSIIFCHSLNYIIANVTGKICNVNPVNAFPFGCIMIVSLPISKYIVETFIICVLGNEERKEDDKNWEKHNFIFSHLLSSSTILLSVYGGSHSGHDINYLLLLSGSHRESEEITLRDCSLWEPLKHS